MADDTEALTYIRIVRPEPPKPAETPTYIRIVRPEPEPDDAPATTPYVPSADSLEYRRSNLAKIAAQIGKPIRADFRPVNLDGDDQ
jgi:hypothetical protein